MKISLLCSDKGHPVRAHLVRWMQCRSDLEISLVEKASEAIGGDFLFLISCHELIRRETRRRYKHVLVVHASDLPKDRGWSPHIWSVIRGDGALIVTLLEAEDAVDSGRIWQKVRIPLVGNEVVDELNELLFSAEIQLLDWAIANVEIVRPIIQDESVATFLRRRTPEDSRIDPTRTIAEQFDLLRVCDSNRYPAFFEYRGRKFYLNMTPEGSLEKQGST